MIRNRNLQHLSNVRRTIPNPSQLPGAGARSRGDELHRRPISRQRRERKERPRERHQPFHLLEVADQRLPKFHRHTRALQRDLEIPLQDAGRDLHRVRGVIDEAPLGLEDLVQPIEHGIERIGEPMQVPVR